MDQELSASQKSEKVTGPKIQKENEEKNMHLSN